MRNLSIGLLFLCSCSFMTPTPTAIDTKPILNLPDPSPMRMGKVEFLIIHKDNAQKVFEDLDAGGTESVVIALTGRDYKMLASNTLQLKAYIKAQQKIIRLYRNYYEGTQNGKGKNN